MKASGNERDPYSRLMELIETIPDFADREEAFRLMPHVIEFVGKTWMTMHKTDCLSHGPLNNKRK
jgi:hypothetical protein